MYNIKSKIPSPNEDKIRKNRIPSPHIGSDGCILFSYELLDINHPYYNVNSLCDKGIQHWVEVLHDVSKLKAQDVRAGRYTNGTLRFHRHTRILDCPQVVSDSHQLVDDFFQIRFGVSKGGIHGILIDNVFFIIWFDPRHLYYFDSRYGPKKKLAKPGECCIERDGIIESLEQEIIKQNTEIQTLNDILEKETRP